MKTNHVEKLQLREVSEQPEARTAGGRVIHDVRGNARWDWAVATAVLATKTFAELINTLDVPALAIHDNDDLDTGNARDPYNSCGRRA
ncbi:MAG: hypothetical protein KGJ68_04675 [Gammaproteobacteria bacterium]|nr:hypothetical protein [Gammaproteobacteria bacterium]